MHSRLRALQKLNEDQIEALQSSEVAVVGLGATGSVIAESLARYGVNLKIFDRDYLEKNDRYSSGLYTEKQCRRSIPKAEAAAEKLKEFTEVEQRTESLNSGNISALRDVDLIMDATDNMKTRFLIDEYSQKTGTPWIYTTALADKGYSMLFRDKCFNCVFDQVRPGELGTCRTEGIVRDVAALAAHRSSLKAFRLLTGQVPDQQLERLPEGESFPVQTSGCEVCEEQRYEKLEGSSNISSVCGENKYQLDVETGEEAFQKLQERAEIIRENEFLVRAMIDGKEFTLYRSGGALVEAEDPGHAEARLSEIIGI